MTEGKHVEANDLEINNLPNRLTIFRILLIPIVIGSLLLSDSSFGFPEELKKDLGWFAAWVFVAASLTDFFDGYIARKRNIVTVFGSFLDPIADKFLTVSSLVMLESLGRIPVLIVIILILREMYMTSLRLLAMHEGISVPVSSWGKWKTATQMIAIPMLMCNEIWQGINFPFLGSIFIYIASFLALWSAFQYSYGLILKLKETRLEKKRLKKQAKEQKKNQKHHTDQESMDEKETHSHHSDGT